MSGTCLDHFGLVALVDVVVFAASYDDEFVLHHAGRVAPPLNDDGEMMMMRIANTKAEMPSQQADLG